MVRTRYRAPHMPSLGQIMASPPVKVILNAQQQSDLKKIKSIAKRGEYIAKAYLESKYKKINFNCNKIKGADISAMVDGVHTAFEVKATRDKNIALEKLKVSSEDSHNLIVGGITVLRVMEADQKEPKVSELRHGVDFNLKAEGRWRAEKP